MKNWFLAARDRTKWRQVTTTFQPPSPKKKTIECATCQRSFSRPSDMVRHKCLAERQLPVDLQRGSLQCSVCQKWFRSKEGFAVHRCRAEPVVPESSCPSVQAIALSESLRSCCLHHCGTCNRCFRSKAGFHRHNCGRGKRATTTERTEYKHQCSLCSRRFRRQQDLTRHRRSCQ